MLKAFVLAFGTLSREALIPKNTIRYNPNGIKRNPSRPRGIKLFTYSQH
jgi:hypothetical protein